MPDDEELIKEMPPLMIDYSALMGRVFLFSKWRRKRKDSRQKREKKKKRIKMMKVSRKPILLYRFVARSKEQPELCRCLSFSFLSVCTVCRHCSNGEIKQRKKKEEEENERKRT